MSEAITETVQRKTKTKTMKAVVFAAPRIIEVKEIEISEPAAGEVRVKLQGCGVCGSNLPVWQGRRWFNYPFEPGNPGHEGWGTIEKIGEGVEGFSKGDRVAYIGFHSYAEYENVSADALVKIPASLDDIPFPGEPFACAVNIFRRSEIQSGQKVAVTGIGFLGAMLVQLASQAGAEVIAISRRPFALAIAERFGAKHVINLNDENLVEKVEQLTDKHYCDVVIEAVGVQKTLDIAGELTGIRKRLVIAGYHQDGNRQVKMQMWNWKGLDVVNAHERYSQVYLNGIETAIKLIEEGKFRPHELLTHYYSIEDIGSAFEDMEERPSGFLKGIIEFAGN